MVRLLASTREDGIERQIGPDDIHGVLYHLREACLTTQRFRARQSKQAMRAIKQLSTALRRANQPKGEAGMCESPFLPTGAHPLRAQAALNQSRKNSLNRWGARAV